MRSGLMLCFSRWNRKGYAIFASLGRNVRIERLERSFEGYVEKVKRAGFKLLPTRTGMEDVFINSYHNLKFEGIPVLGQGTFFIF